MVDLTKTYLVRRVIEDRQQLPNSCDAKRWGQRLSQTRETVNDCIGQDHRPGTDRLCTSPCAVNKLPLPT